MNRLDVEPTQACIWMSAGVLTYKLCDRRFDCEHCPLDAALRGASLEAERLIPRREKPKRRARMTFPEDRLYSAGHTWLQPLKDRPQRLRFGLDGFAHSLLPFPRQIRCCAAPRIFHQGEIICALELEGGYLNLGTPVVARLSGCNPALSDDPGAVITEPYGDGWILELTWIEESDLSQLLAAEAAREQARLDCRRFRRRVALHLLADENDAGAALSDRGALLDDPRCILGDARYLELVQELVH